MSRILKASYVNIENNVIIDNKFSPIQQETDLNEENNNIKNQIENTQPNEVIDTEYQAQLDKMKQDIIEEAKQEADLIIQQAKENAKIEAESIKKQMEEEVNIKSEEIYKESFEKGYDEGKLQAEQDFEQMKQQGQSIIDKAEQERQLTINNLEPEIINFIIDTTKNILTSSFEFNPQIISLLIKKGLLAIKEIKDLKIFVSEQEYDYVDQNKQKILETDTEKNNIEIIKDTSLKDTDCIIETSMGSIQCSIDDQLSSIKEALHYILN